MEFPFNQITAQTSNEDSRVYVYINVQSEYAPVDETGLAHAVQQWLTANVPDVISTSAERHEQVFTVTPLT
ncbi:hypothetical protein AB0F30_17045 [Streptomyces sp. NPDC029006]|uniref:hypothetical protein n=1 Tax=Streptomyces sp. NPDC029006 TaxID=3155467 RepID=UPI0033E8822F